MGKFQHVLHSWVGPAGGYNRDVSGVSPGKWNVKEFKNLWELIERFSREVGVSPRSGTVLTVEECICEGRKHFKGLLHYVKVVFEEGVAFGVAGVFHHPAKKITRVVVL